MSQSSSIDEATAQYLISDESRALRDSVARMPGDAPQRVLALRKRGVPIPFANGVVELTAARIRARGRFSDADRLFFTSDALAQATSARIAAYHAARLAPLGTVADLGCGIGIDAVALARAGAHVLAIERDPVRLLFAHANATVCEVADRIEFRRGDVTDLNWSADAAYWDPSRRESGGDGHRVSRHADRYEPPLSFLATIRLRAPRGGCVKLSPALPDEVLDELDGSIAFLSEGRECKEACVWFGAARFDDDPAYAAVLLPEGFVIARDSAKIGGDAARVVPTGAYIFDPDPAVVRAGSLGGLARAMSGGLVSAADSYLTGDQADADPELRRAASAYRVLGALPYRPRDVGAWLRDRKFGRLVVKKRHFSKEPDAVARELGISGRGAEVTLILVRRDEGGHLAVLCEPVKDDADV